VKIYIVIGEYKSCELGIVCPSFIRRSNRCVLWSDKFDLVGLWTIIVFRVSRNDSEVIADSKTEFIYRW